MGLNYAIDALYATGWSSLDTRGCEFDGGRLYPGVARVEREFRESGFDMVLRRIELFDCYRVEWRAESGEAAGAVVGASEAEAAVHALVQLRRSLVQA
jgi:hypothetical protein